MEEKRKLRKENSINCSGKLYNEYLIPLLKENDYVVKDRALDGNAPKQFIKAYFYKEESGVKRINRKSWFSFIAKTAEKWYPHESVIEFMINRIGQELGLRMNEIKLVRANGQIRFLSKYFLDPKVERLIHGADICGEHLGDPKLAEEIAKDKNTSRDLFTFEFIRDAIRSVYADCCDDIINDLVRMIAFDAIVGNNDRHFYNWGIIDTKKKTKKKPKFAPLYDSARGLLWNESDKNLVNHYKNFTGSGKKIVNYVNRAYPRISIENDKQANHFILLDYLKHQHKDFEQIIYDLSSEENERKVLMMVKKEFYPFFTKERSELVSLILQNRFKIVRGR